MQNTKAFTLIELSIVIVIIGLIVGGVLVGRDLITAAQLRKIISEVENYRVVTMAFKNKYGHLPGDLPNATLFWGQSSNCADPTASGTCNGDGNGFIGSSINWVKNYQEAFRYWQHLSLAGMISGEYTGARYNSIHANLEAGVNAPYAPAGNNTTVFNPGWATESDQYFNNMLSKNILIYLNANAPQNESGVWTTQEAYMFDQKFDDGLPDSGSIGTHKYYSNWAIRECVGTTSPPVYDLADTNANRCRMYFRLE